LFAPVTWAEIAAQFDGPKPSRPRREPRHPLAAAASIQLQSAAELARFGAGLFRRRASPPTERFTDAAAPGDTLFALGSPWFEPEYPAIARWVRDNRRMRFVLLVHDLVPIRRPEWSPPGVVRRFEAWHAALLPFCDGVLANSRHTAGDVEAFARERGIALSRPVQPVPIGGGFVTAPNAAPVGPLPAAGSYVLFVATLEPRKNHALAVRIWTMLLAEVRAGRRAAETVPDLVFAGRVGWLMGDLVQQLENTSWLGGRVRHMPDASDAELRALYAGALF